MVTLAYTCFWYEDDGSRAALSVIQMGRVLMSYLALKFADIVKTIEPKEIVSHQ